MDGLCFNRKNKIFIETVMYKCKLMCCFWWLKHFVSTLVASPACTCNIDFVDVHKQYYDTMMKKKWQPKHAQFFCLIFVLSLYHNNVSNYLVASLWKNNLTEILMCYIGNDKNIELLNTVQQFSCVVPPCEQRTMSPCFTNIKIHVKQSALKFLDFHISSHITATEYAEGPK